jgi:hypothetical protein
LAGFALAEPSAALATSKTEVGVSFQLTDKHYLDEFRDDQVPEILARAGAAAAGALNERIRFLSFTANPAAPYRLAITLDRAEGSPADLPAEFGFRIALDGPDVREDARTYIKFRGMEHYSDLIVSIDSLVEEIRLRISQADYTSLIGSVLKYVAIADGGEFASNPARWIIATDPGESCFDIDSRLRVTNRFPPRNGISRYPFEGMVRESSLPGRLVVMLDPNADPPMSELLRTTPPTDLKVEKIFVIVYRRFCARPVAPSQVDFSQ